MTKYYVREDGTYIGAFVGYTPFGGEPVEASIPVGGIEIPNPPVDARDVWNGNSFVLHEEDAPAAVEDQVSTLLEVLKTNNTISDKDIADIQAAAITK